MTVEVQSRRIEEVKVQEEEEELWSTDYLIYKIKHDLAVFVISGTDTDSLAGWCRCRDRKDALLPLVIWKYYHQAMHFFKIGAFASNIPKFLISMADLNPSIVRELAGLDNEVRKFVLKQAVAHIFEDINSRLYHMSISKLLEVRLVD